MTFIQKINPINKDEEKRKFFFDPQYNPQFEYAEEIDEDEYYKYGTISCEFLPQAERILSVLIKKYGSKESYVEQIEGDLLSKSVVQEQISQYIQEEHVDDSIRLEYSREAISRTSIVDSVLRVRQPMMYREHSLVGVLRHEVGTHYLRTLNDRRQPWHGNRSRFALGPYLETEEGLGVLHQYMHQSDPILVSSALYYAATWYGFHHTFSELFSYLATFIQEKERAWKMCVRVKRGMRDTSQHGAFSRNQLYFSGAIRVAKYLVDTDFDLRPLYLGKVSIEDGVRLIKDVFVEPTLPSFYTHNPKQYKEALRAVIHHNHLLSFSTVS